RVERHRDQMQLPGLTGYERPSRTDLAQDEESLRPFVESRPEAPADLPATDLLLHELPAVDPAEQMVPRSRRGILRLEAVEEDRRLDESVRGDLPLVEDVYRRGRACD